MLIELDLARALVDIDHRWRDVIDSLSRGVVPAEMDIDGCRAELVTDRNRATYWRDLLDHYGRPAPGASGDELQRVSDGFDRWAQKLDKALAALADQDVDGLS